MKKTKRGFSLVELLVALAILGGVAVATSRVFFANLRGTQKAQRLIELQQAGEQTLNTLVKRIRTARSVRLIDSTGSVRECTATPISENTLEAVRRNPLTPGFASASTWTARFSCFLDDRGTADPTDDVYRLKMNETETITGKLIKEGNLTPNYLTIKECENGQAIFTCEKTAGAPVKVKIEFTLQNTEKESRKFGTTVLLRNF